MRKKLPATLRRAFFLIAISALFIFSVEPAEAACSQPIIDESACVGADFIKHPETYGDAEPKCGCPDTHFHTGYIPGSGGPWICCKKGGGTPAPSTAGKVYYCKFIKTGKILDCQPSDAACMSPEALSACGMPADPSKCAKTESTTQTCDQLKAAGTTAPPGAAPKKAAPIPQPQNPLGTTDVAAVLGRIVNVFLGLSGSIALLMFVYGGFTWITSGGSAERISQGKNTIVWSIIGIAFIFLSYVILKYIVSIFSA